MPAHDHVQMTSSGDDVVSSSSDLDTTSLAVNEAIKLGQFSLLTSLLLFRVLTFFGAD